MKLKELVELMKDPKVDGLKREQYYRIIIFKDEIVEETYGEADKIANNKTLSDLTVLRLDEINTDHFRTALTVFVK